MISMEAGIDTEIPIPQHVNFGIFNGMWSWFSWFKRFSNCYIFIHVIKKSKPIIKIS